MRYTEGIFMAHSRGKTLFFHVIFQGLALLGFFVSCPFFAQAQSEGGLSLVISPLPISLTTEPGTSIATDLKIKNGGMKDEELGITVMKFRAYESSGKPQLMEREDGDVFFDWVDFSEPTFTLAPNEWKTVTATFTIPEEASFGYYYAFVFSRVETEKPLEEKQTAVIGGTAVLVLLDVRVPDAKREVEVVEFSTDKKFYEFLPAKFNVKLRNTGNVHIAPRGNIFIDRGDVHDIALLEINNEKGNILPNSNRVFETNWKDGFPLYKEKIENGKIVLDEDGEAVYQLKWDWNDASKLRFGKYTAKMLLIYDDGQRDIPIEGEVSFWVMPWRLLLIVLVVALFFFIGFRSAVMHLWRKIFRRRQADREEKI